MNRKGGVETSLIILSAVMISLFILAGMATQTSTIFSTFGNDSDWGVIGFLVNHFNLVLFIALTLALFVGVSAWRSR